MYIVEFVGRIFLSTLFLIEGVGKISMKDDVVMYMEDYGVPGILFCMTPGWFHKNHVTHPKTGSIGLPSPAACDTAELALEHAL